MSRQHPLPSSSSLTHPYRRTRMRQLCIKQKWKVCHGCQWSPAKWKSARHYIISIQWTKTCTLAADGIIDKTHGITSCKSAPSWCCIIVWRDTWMTIQYCILKDTQPFASAIAMGRSMLTGLQMRQLRYTFPSVQIPFWVRVDLWLVESQQTAVDIKCTHMY
jgi:hypothetical protein